MSSYSARDAKRRGSTVPPLAGVDRPQLETVPNTCDVLICGTGLTESILAAALAWQGTNVLHIDANEVYGDASACLTVKQLSKWVNNNIGTESLLDGSNPQLYVPRARANAGPDSERYIVDLAPHMMFARSDMLELLIKSRVFQYLEFKSISQFHTYQEDAFEKVNGNKEAIFTDQSLSHATKRRLMKFVKFVYEWKVDDATFSEMKKVPIGKWLAEQWQLESPQITELAISIGLCDSLDVPAAVALPRIRRYLVSLDVYGQFPALFSMYGSGGELAQGFCRSAAVAGATYKLGTKLVAWDETSNIATLSDGSRVQVAEKVFVSPTQPTDLRPLPSVTDQKSVSTHMVAVVSNECREWFGEGESAAIVLFPPGTLNDNKYAVQTIVYGPGSGHVPRGSSCWYLCTHNPDQRAAREDVSNALTRLEASILRESQADFELGSLSKDDVTFRNGTPIVSSVRIGESMHNFVPKEKLQYMFKLCYTAPTAASMTAPLAPINDSKVVFSTHFQPGDLSYDGFVTQARKLYETVVGSDDDFFDVDFEDGDEDQVVPDVVPPAEEVMHLEI